MAKKVNTVGTCIQALWKHCLIFMSHVSPSESHSFLNINSQQGSGGNSQCKSVHGCSNCPFLPLLRSPRGLAQVAKTLTIHCTFFPEENIWSAISRLSTESQKYNNKEKNQSAEVYSCSRMISAEGASPLDCVIR